jgi:hypothetical protein
MTWRRGVGLAHEGENQSRVTMSRHTAHDIPANIPAASHTAAGATNLGRRRTWGHVFAGREGAACRFMPAGIAVERPSPDSSVVEQWLSFKLRALSEGEGCTALPGQQRFKRDRAHAANGCCCCCQSMPPPVALHRPHAPRFSTTPVLAVTTDFHFTPRSRAGPRVPTRARHHNLTLATNGFRLMMT